MEAKRSEELLAGSVGDTESHGWALFSILHQLELINGKLDVIAGQSQPLTVPPGSITDQGGGDVEYNDDFDSDTPPDGPPDEPELDDDPETPEDEHYEKPVEGPPGVAS
ncbi:hypothetical protein [uncultured Mediterranean phage]|nr:hypothetical protein [uncultured Mediterranean phage]